MDPKYNKVERTLETMAAELERFAKVCRPDGMLAKNIDELDGDNAYLRDIVKSLNTAMDAISDQLYSVGVAQAEAPFGESVMESAQINESTGLLDAADEDGFMARSQLYFMARDAIKLHGMIGDRDELEPWVQSKITTAAESMEVLRQHIEYKQIARMENDPGVPADVEDEFHNNLDDLVHDTFGPSSDEMDDVKQDDIKEDDYTVSVDNRSSTKNGVNNQTRKIVSTNRTTGQSSYSSINSNDGKVSSTYADQTGFVATTSGNDSKSSYSYEAPVRKAMQHTTKKVMNQSANRKGEVVEQAEFDDGSTALNPETIAKNMMKAAKKQAAKKVKGE
jgi:hypothetical protein